MMSNQFEIAIDFMSVEELKSLLEKVLIMYNEVNY